MYSLLVFPVDNEEQYQSMNKKAHEMKLIAPEERLLTMSDVEAVMATSALDDLDKRFNCSKITAIQSVPSTIKMGKTQKLVECMLEKIKANGSLTPITSSSKDRSLHDKEADDAETRSNLSKSS